MGLRRVPTWIRLALLFVPFTVVWCLVWLLWNATDRRRKLPPAGQPLPVANRLETSETSCGAPEPIPRPWWCFIDLVRR